MSDTNKQETRLDMFRQLWQVYGLTPQQGIDLANALEDCRTLNNLSRTSETSEVIAFFSGMLKGKTATYLND